jgi:large subunit ribosomal protein L24
MANHIKAGDNVYVLSGNDKGKTGEVLKIIPKHDTCIVQGVNVRTKHVKPNQQNQQGGIVRLEMPVHVSNVSPCVGGKPSRVRFEVREDGSKARVAARDGSELHVLRSASKGGKKASKKKAAG